MPQSLIGGKYQTDSHMNPDDCIVSSSRQMGSRMQCQCTLRLEALNYEAALSLRGSVWDEVAKTKSFATLG